MTAPPNIVSDAPILVAGGGGFIGGHLVANVRSHGHPHIRSVDLKPLDQWYQRFPDVDNRVLDLRDLAACREAVDGCRIVYNLAADMGGMGFIENNKALCMLSVLINTHLLLVARDAGVSTYFFASSACVHAGITDPINLGSAEMVTINRLVDLAEEIGGVTLERRYNLDAPKGVCGRSSDNTLIQSKLGWQPSTPLRTGLEITYRWIEQQIARGARSL